MAAPAYTLTPAGFAAAFPFHVVFDADGCLLQVGEALGRIAPEIRPDQDSRDTGQSGQIARTGRTSKGGD